MCSVEACVVGGVCMVGGACMAGGHAWQGACVAGGVRGGRGYASYWNAYLLFHVSLSCYISVVYSTEIQTCDILLVE